MSKTFYDIIKNMNLINPDSYILEVGSGCGELVSQFLDVPFVEWQGIEVSEEKIGQCFEKLSPKDKRLTFLRIDVHHSKNNPESGVVPAEYQFPYQDNHFDLVIMGDVLKKFMPTDMMRYCLEASRVVNTYGKIVIIIPIAEGNIRFFDVDENGIVYYELEYIESLFAQYNIKPLQSLSLDDNRKVMVFVKN